MTLPVAFPSAIRVAFVAMAIASPAFATTARAAGILPGAAAKDPYTVDAGKLDYLEKDGKLVYSGNVIATQGATKVKGTTMTIYLDKGPGNDRQVRRIEVAGPVTVVQNGKIGVGDSGLYDKAENKWYLLGNVTLTQGTDVTQGDKLIYDLGNSTALVDAGKQGRVKSIFTPKDTTRDTTKEATKETVGASKPAAKQPAAGRP